ncbi:MAG: hypothetical protein JOZ05_07785, partial [Acetobacteraceae bacterium]|nr:hypothetical protein [Acetobacteraceae bacterium]
GTGAGTTDPRGATQTGTSFPLTGLGSASLMGALASADSSYGSGRFAIAAQITRATDLPSVAPDIDRSMGSVPEPSSLLILAPPLAAGALARKRRTR